MSPRRGSAIWLDLTTSRTPVPDADMLVEWHPQPTPCRECGPGYFIGDEGCRHVAVGPSWSGLFGSAPGIDLLGDGNMPDRCPQCGSVFAHHQCHGLHPEEGQP